MVEGGEQIDFLGQQHAVAKNVAAHIADAGYGARPLATGTAAQTPETRPHPLAAKETRHLILAIALSLPLVLPMLALPFGQHWMLPGWLRLSPPS